MARKYANAIKNGTMTLDQVPARWKAEVERILDEEN